MKSHTPLAQFYFLMSNDGNKNYFLDKHSVEDLTFQPFAQIQGF